MKGISKLTICDVCNDPNLGYTCVGCPFIEESKIKSDEDNRHGTADRCSRSDKA